MLAFAFVPNFVNVGKKVIISIKKDIFSISGGQLPLIPPIMYSYAAVLQYWFI